MKNLYRYEIEYKNEHSDTWVYLHEYPIIREKNNTYFIEEKDKVARDILGRKEKRVRKNAINTYAFDTKEKAKEHFIRRTQTRIKWFNFWKNECEKALKIIQEA